MNPPYGLFTRYSEAPGADAAGDRILQHMNF